MKDGNAIQRITILVTFGVLSLTAAMAIGQELPYTEGSVWSISMIRVKPGMFEVYMREVLPARKKIFDEAKKQELVISTHTLSGNATGRDDFNVMFLDEYKNWAAFDGIDAHPVALEEAGRAGRRRDREAELEESHGRDHAGFLVAVGERKEDRAVVRQLVAGSGLALRECHAERAVDAHDLAGGTHLGTEDGVDLGKAVERKHCFLHRDVASRRGRPTRWSS